MIKDIHYPKKHQFISFRFCAGDGQPLRMCRAPSSSASPSWRPSPLPIVMCKCRLQIQTLARWLCRATLVFFTGILLILCLNLPNNVCSSWIGMSWGGPENVISDIDMTVLFFFLIDYNNVSCIYISWNVEHCSLIYSPANFSLLTMKVSKR